MAESCAVDLRRHDCWQLPVAPATQHAPLEDGLQFLVPCEGANVICMQDTRCKMTHNKAKMRKDARLKTRLHAQDTKGGWIFSTVKEELKQ